MGWIITGSILALLLLLLLCPVSLRFTYREDVLTLSGHYLFLKKQLLPQQEPEEVPPPPEEKEEEKKKVPLKEKLQQLWEKLQPLWELTKSSKRALLLLKRHLVFYRLRVFALVGGDDAHSIGEEYGTHCTIITGAIGLLSQFFYVKEPILWVHPDFLAPKSEYDISLRVRIRPLFVIGALLLLLVQYLKVQSRLKPKKPIANQNKGGKRNEPKQSSE